MVVSGAGVIGGGMARARKQNRAKVSRCAARGWNRAVGIDESSKIRGSKRSLPGAFLALHLVGPQVSTQLAPAHERPALPADLHRLVARRVRHQEGHGGQVYLVTYDNTLYAFGIPLEH